MSVKILELGNKIKTHKTKCDLCGSLLEYQNEDIRFCTSYMEEVIDCPNCRSKVIIDDD